MTPRLLLPLLVVVLLAACSERPAAPEPRTAPSTAPADGADASLLDLVVTPGAVERRASLWQLRDDERAWTLALSDDGFATRRLLEVPAGSRVVALGAGRYVLAEGWSADRIRVVGVAPGADLQVRVAGPAAPLATREALLVAGEPGRLRLLGVAADGRAHPVPAPRGLYEVGGQGGRIDGLAFADRTTYHWSDDGGATWQHAALGADGPAFLARRIPTGAGQPPVVLEGSDGATLFPFLALWRAPAGGTPWTRTPIARRGGHVTTTGGWVGADGAVRVLAGAGGRSGVWRVTGGRLERVRGDRPRVVDRAEVSPLLVETGPRPVVWVNGAPGEAWRSEDDGTHWTRFATR